MGEAATCPEVKGPPFTTPHSTQHLDGDLSGRQSDGLWQPHGKVLEGHLSPETARSYRELWALGAAGLWGRDTGTGRCPQEAGGRWELTQALTQQALPRRAEGPRGSCRPHQAAEPGPWEGSRMPLSPEWRVASSAQGSKMLSELVPWPLSPGLILTGRERKPFAFFHVTKLVHSQPDVIHSFPHSLIHSFIPSFPHSFPHSHIHSLVIPLFILPTCSLRACCATGPVLSPGTPPKGDSLSPAAEPT